MKESSPFVGNGTVINLGSIVIRGGKIASVAAGPANARGLQTIDGRGMTALPGFIDGDIGTSTPDPMRTCRISASSSRDAACQTGAGTIQGAGALR